MNQTLTRVTAGTATVSPGIIRSAEPAQNLWRTAVTTLVIIDFLVLLGHASAFYLDLGLGTGTAAQLDANLLVCIAFSIFFVKKEHRSNSIDAGFLFAVLAFTLVVLARSFAGEEKLAEPFPDAIRHAMLVPLPIISFAFVCPRILSQKNYLIIFTAILAIFSSHAILSAWLCLSDTHVILNHDLSRFEGRAPALFGSPGTLLTGLAWNPNALGASLLLLPSLAAMLEHKASSRTAKTAARIAFILTCTQMILTFSRATIATAFAAITLWVALSRRSPRAAKWISATLLLLGGIFLLSQLAIIESDPSLEARQKVWESCLSQISHNLWGCGLPPTGLERLSHNLLLGTTLYFGVPGLILFLLVITILLAKAFTKVSTGSAFHLMALTLLLTVVLHGNAEYCIGQSGLFANSLFWLIAGYLAYTPADSGAHSYPLEKAKVAT